MRTYESIAPCRFRLEAVLKKETLDLGYEISLVEDSRATFIGDDEAICRASIFLRTAERVLLKVGSFKAEVFEELFQGTKAIAREEYMPEDEGLWVAKASPIKGKLFSPPDIQSIMKRTTVGRTKKYYGASWFPGNGANYPLHVFLYRDVVTMGIDASGDSLHRHGYRTLTSKVSIAETLVTALVMSTLWNRERILVDPFCGSGTLPIEAAMMAANMALGMNHSFLSEDWENLIKRKCWHEIMDEANELVDRDVKVDIQGYDIDGDIIKAARANTESTGMDHVIHFQRRSINALSHPKKYGFIISNPPYNEWLEEKPDLPVLYREIGGHYATLDAWSAYLVTSYEDTEQCTGREADEGKRIYNGMMRTHSCQFMGPRPPRRSQESKEN